MRRRDENRGLTTNKRETMTMDNKKTNRGRRQVLTAAGLTTMAVWHKPLINQVVLPAHAQASVCPMIRVDNVVSGPVSGTNTPPVCSVTFDVLSSDEFVPLEITAITTGDLPNDVTITIDGLGTATSTDGPRVTWEGPAADAPFCTDIEPTDDITFTVSATCDAVMDGGTFDQEFTLTDIIALQT